MTKIYIREPKHMTVAELRKELRNTRRHIRNDSFGRWELVYEVELIEELERRKIPVKARLEGKYG